MAKLQGRFVWYELMTGDSKRAQQFYREVVGWEARDAERTDRRYTILSAGETGVAGILEPRGASGGKHPFWIGYIGVDDVDRFTDRVEQAGGKVHRKPEDLPTVGRFSVVADPGGAVFALFRPEGQPASESSQPESVPMGQPGRVAWHELHATDGPAEFSFYSSLFGWEKGEAMDMGPMGVYQLFTAGGSPLGGIMTKMPEMPETQWLYYISVDAADAAVERIRQAGGTVLLAPHEVPGGAWIVQGLDPAGAMFGLLASKR